METLSVPDARFCFDTLPYLTSCACDDMVTSCLLNPCVDAVCPSFPEAVCHINFCTQCKAVWIYQNKEVDCEGYRGPHTIMFKKKMLYMLKKFGFLLQTF